MFFITILKIWDYILNILMCVLLFNYFKNLGMNDFRDNAPLLEKYADIQLQNFYRI